MLFDIIVSINQAIGQHAREGAAINLKDQKTDIIYFSDNIHEAGFRNRMSGSKKIALRKYARNNKQRIKRNVATAQ